MDKLEYDKILKQSKECILNKKCYKCPNNIKRKESSLLSCIMNKCYIFIDTKSLIELDASELHNIMMTFGLSTNSALFIEFIIDEFNNTKDLLIKER